MKTIGAAEFKEQCLALLERLDPDGVIITKRGKAIAKLVPWRESPGQLIGALKGRIAIKGDILTTGRCWDAEP